MIYNNKYIHRWSSGLMISDFQSEDPGSIPGRGFQYYYHYYHVIYI